MTIWRCYEAAAGLKAGVPAAGGSIPLPGKPLCRAEGAALLARAAEGAAAPALPEAGSKQAAQPARLACKKLKKGKQDFFGYAKGQRNMLREEMGGCFQGPYLFGTRLFMRDCRYSRCWLRLTSSLSSAAQFEAKFSSVERIQPAAGKACVDHSTLPKKEKLRGVRSASVAPTSIKSP